MSDGKKMTERTHILDSKKRPPIPPPPQVNKKNDEGGKRVSPAANPLPLSKPVSSTGGKGISGGVGKSGGTGRPSKSPGSTITSIGKIGSATPASTDASSQRPFDQASGGRLAYVNEAITPSPTSPTSNDDMSQLVHQLDLEEEPPKSTLPQASFNYINSIIGSGVIGMPAALHQSGVVLGVVLLIFTAFVTDYSLVLMVKAGHLSGTYSYQGMMEAAFGKWGFYVLSFLQFVYPLIAMISYNVIVGDTLTKVLVYFTEIRPEAITLEREFVVFLSTVLVTLPLSLYRDVARMAKISFLSLISIGFIMLSILIRYGTLTIPNVTYEYTNTGVLQALGIFAFAFMCHHNTFMIYTSMENTNVTKWTKVTHISIGVSLLISIIFSVGGYATFGSHVQSDLLENYCWDDDLINFSRVLFCFTILLTFPLECFVARDVVENICFERKNASSTARHFSVTVFIIITAFIISMATDCLGLVLELNGFLAAIPLAFILPSLCYIRLEPSRLLSREKIPAILTASFGIIISVTGLIFMTFEGHSSSTCSHGKAMSYCSNQPDVVFPNGTIGPSQSTLSLFSQMIPVPNSSISSQIPQSLP